MEVLLGKTLAELQAVAQEVGLPRFAGKQLAEWIYVRRATSFDEMTNISLKGREALKAHYTIGRHKPVAEAISKDGTKKYLFAIDYGDEARGDEAIRREARYIESVYIPDNDRATLCVSTQAGCKMGCKFCMTGTLGFHGHLTAADILNQIFSIPDSDKLTNIVYMGEGEPMDNLDNVLRSLEVMTSTWGCAWSPKRITVSSVGLLHRPHSKQEQLLQRFIEESDCHLAISLHNPFGVERQEIMPIEKVNPLNNVIELLKRYDWSHQRRVSFEYICWGGVNDTPKHANELLRLLKGLDCRINLIRFHGPSPALPSREGVPPLKGEVRWGQSDEQQMEWLRDYLTERGITTTIRRSRGEDILAACGMLVNALQQK